MTNRSTGFEHLEVAILRQEIAILKQLHELEKRELLENIARKLTKKNMAFPVIREIVALPEEELRGIFFGGSYER